MKRSIIYIVLAVSLAACSPRLMPPQVTPTADYLYGRGFVHDSISLDERWWQLFGDTTLNALVERALANNRDIAVALSRVVEAHDNLKNVKTEFLPQVGIEVEAEGEYTHKTKIEQNYVIAPTLSWEISLFGAWRHARRAAKAELAAMEWSLRGTQLSLSAEVATTYFTLLEYRRDLAIARQTLRLRRESSALIDSMFRYGMSDGVARDQAMSLVYSAEADIPQYRRAVAQTWLSMCVLLGESPSLPPSDDRDLPFVTDLYPTEIPIGLPSELLLRRPDILEARYNMLQAAAQAGEARSARFPSIELTGKGGVASTSIEGLTGAHPWMWSAVGSLTQPIFAFGKLRRAEVEAIEAYNQSTYTYEQTVLTAFADTESALVAISTMRRQTERTGELVMANQRIADMTRALYRNGLSDYLSVIDADRELYASQMQFVNLMAQQYINYVTLCKALGGGFSSAE